jgi:hypothetical protein
MAQEFGELLGLETFEVMARLLPDKAQKMRFAHRIGKSYSAVVKQCEQAGADPSLHGIKNAIDVLLALCLVSGQPQRVLGYCAAQFGLVVQSGGERRAVETADVLTGFLDLTREAGEAMAAMAAAAADGKIDPDEVSRVRGEVEDVRDKAIEVLSDLGSMQQGGEE